MAGSREQRRLFVGGLGPSVTQDDVRAQLGRFGDVSSVELVTRVDELGNPTKTFAYADVALSEGELSKCMSALNKTKWKGGTLQIQLAKESFLHRLAKERLQAKVKKEQQLLGETPADPETSQGKNGIQKFHMKAVPGTEVPGHKDWVVSKFGRVLPVLHLRSQNKRKILKYDPSKYCHNLKKFEQDVINTVSISDLTWKLEGGDDIMSKKRQGQFPTFSCPTKRRKVEGDLYSHYKVAQCSEVTSPALLNKAQLLDGQRTNSRPGELPMSVFSKHRNNLKPAMFLQDSKSRGVRSKNSMSDDDIDSEEELKAMIAEEKIAQKLAFPETNGAEDDSFEVVSSDFKPQLRSPGMKRQRTEAPCSKSSGYPAEDGQEYDSGGTDELIAEGKMGDQSENEQNLPSKNKAKQKEKDSLEKRIKCVSSGQAAGVRKGRKPTGKERGSVSKQLSCSSPESESAESEDLDYAAMMTNCYRLDLSLADLERLAKQDPQSPEEKASHATQDLPEKQVPVTGRKNEKAAHKGARCIDPVDILASLLKGEEKINDQNPPKESVLKSKFQAFRGVGALYGGEAPKNPLKDGLTIQTKVCDSLKQEAPPGNFVRKQGFNSVPCSSVEMSSPPDGREANGNSLPHCLGKFQRKRPASEDQGSVQSPSCNSECDSNSVISFTTVHSKKPSHLYAKASRTNLGGDDGVGSPEMGDPKQERRETMTPRPSSGQQTVHEPTIRKIPPKRSRTLSVGRGSTAHEQENDLKGSQEREMDLLASHIPSSDAVTPSKNCQDNQKRLAALEERMRERELQKQLVHSALASVDGQPTSKPTHILFSSDSEDGAEEKEDNEKSLPGHGVPQDSASKSSGKLFGSSDDEESESDDDEARFQIKPQFEGKAGKKLMSLQSHFGADDRFRMDARFLESGSEEEEEEENEAGTAEEQELVAEKKKNMDVIKNILQVDHQTPKPSKEELAGKQFRSIVRYDPTRPDHATFERKVDPEEKESKAARRKKREEAEKLPQVSQDLYYSIASDLKERFQASEPAPGAGAAGPWNEAPEETETAAPAPQLSPGGFTFSFFGPDTGDVKEEPYKIEAKTPARLAWQQDPRFQDSSSEEEEEELEPEDRSKEAAKAEEMLSEKPTSRFFFFSESDERLRVGPDLFWRGSESRPSSEDWESRTLLLLQDCRKKHKAAKRKAKP